MDYETLIKYLTDIYQILNNNRDNAIFKGDQFNTNIDLVILIYITIKVK